MHCAVIRFIEQFLNVCFTRLLQGQYGYRLKAKVILHAVRGFADFHLEGYVMDHELACFLVLSDVAQRDGCLRPMLVPSSSILQYPPPFPLPHVCRPHFKSVGLPGLLGGCLLALGDPASESSS